MQCVYTAESVLLSSMYTLTCIDSLHWEATVLVCVLQVIPMDAMGFHEAFNIRVDELQVLDLQFLYGCPRPTVALLYQDNKNARHLKTCEISLKDKVLS